VRLALPWIAAYLAILLAWALVILRRTGPTLWKGSSLAALNIALILLSATVTLLRGTSLDDGMGGTAWCCFSVQLAAFDLVLLVIAILVGRKWLVLGMSPAETMVVLERCFAQTRASSVRHAEGYLVQCGGAEMTVNMRPRMARVVSVRFTGAKKSKKADLVRKLFGKQFHSSVPRPRFRA
jgi:hypothetical protein